jgi:hypothetical protein
MDTSTINIIESGLARCVTEARGSHGLEGYGLDQSYRFERCEDKKGRFLITTRLAVRASSSVISSRSWWEAEVMS